jgi:hypothetical protein
VVTSQVIFREAEQVVVWGGQIRPVEWIGEQFPDILKANGEPNVNKLSDIPKFPSSGLHGAPLQATLHFLWLLSLGLVWWARRFFACYAQLQQFWVDHSAAAGTHAGISTHTTKSVVDDLTRNWMTARWRNDMSVTAIFL